MGIRTIFHLPTGVFAIGWGFNKNLVISQIGGLPSKQDTYSSPNVDRFSKHFHPQSQQGLYNETVIKDPSTPQMHRYTLCQCRETANDLKQMSHLTINFNLFYYS